MAILVALTARGAKATALTSPSATVPPAQQKPMLHLVLCDGEPVPFMSSGQHSSIDMPAPSSICMLVCISSDDAITAADAPIGSIATDRAIANARMVRTSRIEMELPFRSQSETANISQAPTQSLIPLNPA